MGVVEGGEAERDLSETFLVRLHRRVIVSVQRYNCTQCQWNKTIEQAVYLEDVCRNQASGSRMFMATASATRGFLWSSYQFPKMGKVHQPLQNFL
jgi:hypothetical protein